MHTKFHTTNILRLTIENTAWFFLFLPPRRGLFFGGRRTPGFASLHPGLNSFAASRLQNHPVGTRFVRELPVILDADVAELYGVETKRVNEAVRNNPTKFPPDYMFELDTEESRVLRSNVSTLEHTGKGKHSKYSFKAFTEKGLYMLATILKSPPGVTPENIKTLHASRPHNPKLAQVLYKATRIENWGSGIQRIISTCLNQELPEPVYDIWADGTIVIVFRKKTVQNSQSDVHQGGTQGGTQGKNHPNHQVG